MLTCSRVRGDNSTEGSFLATGLVGYFPAKGTDAARAHVHGRFAERAAEKCLLFLVDRRILAATATAD